MRNIAIIGCAGTLFACTHTYHPEYHPVTLTTVNHSTSGANAPPIVVEQPRLANPEVFFQHP